MLGLNLLVPPQVFHPGLSLSSKTMGEYVLSLPLDRKQVLDMGCGSGILSLAAASAGAFVTAVDINPAAVASARENARRNGLEDRIRVFDSNLFGALPEETFHYLLFNPPFYLGKPHDVRDMAWRGGDDYGVIRGFIAGASRFLKPDARIIMILSSDMRIEKVLEIFRAHDFSVDRRRVKRLLFETFSIYEGFRGS
jgi:release factor glutamine methyltransferase